MQEGPAYLLLDEHGAPIDVLESLEAAIAAAGALVPEDQVFLDAPTEQDYEAVEGVETAPMPLAANPSDAVLDAMQALASAMRRPLPADPTTLIDWSAAKRMSLKAAHERLVPFFPTRRTRKDGLTQAVSYRTPEHMAKKILGENYKTSKETPKRIIAKLEAETGFRQAKVMALSILPNTQSYSQGYVKEIVRDAKSRYGVKSALPVRLNSCVRATPECASSCLAFSGFNLSDDYNTMRKYALMSALVHEPEAFVRMLMEAIRLHQEDSVCHKTMPLVRLNVYSDLPWEVMVPGLFEHFHDIQFYDYTKIGGRVVPDNYDITFSYAGTPGNVDTMDDEIRKHGRRVAIVFAATGMKRMYEVTYKTGRATVTRRSGELKVLKALAKRHGTSVTHLGKVEIPRKVHFYKEVRGTGRPVEFAAKMPSTFIGLPVIDGDESDMRPYDEAPSIVGLRWKPPRNQGITLEDAKVFIVLVNIEHSGGGYYNAVVSKTPRFDETRPWADLDYSDEEG